MKNRIEAPDTQMKVQKEQLIQIQSHNDDERNARLAAVAQMIQLSQSGLIKQMRDAKMMLENEHQVHSETIAYFNCRHAKISEMSLELQQKYESETKMKKTDRQNRKGDERVQQVEAEEVKGRAAAAREEPAKSRAK